jgi:hypothetical protein
MCVYIYIEIQHLFILKSLNKLEIEAMYLNIIKAIHDKLKVILNGEKLKLFPLKSGMRQGCPLSSLLFNIVLEFLAREIKQEKEMEGFQIREEEIKLSLFIDNRILYLKDPKDHPKLLDLINTLSNIAGYKINIQKSAAFPYTKNKQGTKEIRKTVPLIIISKTT